MLDNLSLLAPLFTMMALGFVMGRTPICREGSGAAQALSIYVWWIAIPALLIKLIAGQPLPSGAEMQLVGTYYLVLYVIYALATMIVAPMIGVSKRGRAIFAYSCTFGNLGFIAIPVIKGVYGDEGLRILLMIISFHSMTLMTVSIVITELLSGKTEKPLQTFRDALLNTLKNPIVVGLAGSLLWAATGLGLNETITNIVDLPASSAAPVGLFAVGLSLSRVKLSGIALSALPAMSMKMALLPFGVYFTTYHIMDFPVLWVGVATLTAAMPTGALAYTLAAEYHCNEERAASTVVVSTALSSISLMLIISWL